ncbi:MAG TPA: hypothetical protein VGQ39_14600 [Pyrinomonadaceae bacterium]|jgi:uncharacterized repeat protein (TIGR01451 family)|nr:hypothetical protein [Pyrinomonadaceae bacterium]
MKQFSIKDRLLPALFISVMVASGVAAFSLRNGAPAQNGTPVMKITLSGTIARSSGKVAIEKAGSVNPGEVINYTILSNNEGSGPARDFKTVGPIPARTIYVDGSAKAEGAIAVYSIDGGKSYFAKPMIDERQPDGTTKRVPAPLSMYTQVRFEWSNPIAANSQYSASYQVRLK